jgi:GNAT superfamily N-acetyltransferase
LLSIVQVRPAAGAHWSAAMRIYQASFPGWEREPVHVIARRVDQARYLMKAGLLDGKVIGFYILDLNPAQGFALFAFVAVTAAQRGKGLGGELCRDAIAVFRMLGQENRWFLVEAEERQAIFYGRMGFLDIGIDYRVPRFDNEGSVPMHLMTVPRHPGQSMVSGELGEIVRRLFLSGYSLDEDDPRIAAQLAKVPATIPLKPWPPQDGE